MPGQISPLKREYGMFLFGDGKDCVETSSVSSPSEYSERSGGTSERAEDFRECMRPIVDLIDELAKPAPYIRACLVPPLMRQFCAFFTPAPTTVVQTRGHDEAIRLLHSAVVPDSMWSRLREFFTTFLTPSQTSVVQSTWGPAETIRLHQACGTWFPNGLPAEHEEPIRLLQSSILPDSLWSNVREFGDWLWQPFAEHTPFREFVRSLHLDVYAIAGVKASLAVGIPCGIAYLFWRWYHDTKVRFNERGAVFTGTQTMPVCLHCNSEITTFCTVSTSHTMYKRFHIPRSCARCSLVPAVYGSVRSSIGITAPEYQCIMTYGQLNAARSRDIHSSLTNILDSSTSYSARQAFLNNHLEALHDMESAYHSFMGLPCYDGWTRSYRQATPWLDVGDIKALLDGASNDRGYQFCVLNRLRSVWTWTANHAGQVPQMAIMDGSMDRVRELVTVPRAYARSFFNQSLHITAAETGAQPLEPSVIEPPMQGPKDQTTWYISNAKAFKLGPVFSFFSIWDTKFQRNLLSILQGRSKNSKVYKPASPCSLRIGRCYSAFRSGVLKPKRVLKAFNAIMKEYDYDLIKMLRGKFTEEQIQEALDMMEVCEAKDIPKRKLNAKFELIAKMFKFERGVVDNQLFLLAVNVLSGKILEYLMFHKPDGMKNIEENTTRDDEIERPSQGSHADKLIGTEEGGVFSRMCIKEEDRSKVLDKIIGECSREVPGEPTMLGEVDQTGMELHERCSKDGEGVMGHFLSLLQTINTIIAPKLQARLVGLHGAKLAADVKSGMVLKLRLKERNLTVKFPDLYLDSGWLLTSAMNFMNECFVTYSAHVSNPEHLFVVNRKTDRFRIEEGTHDWFFESIYLPQVHYDVNGVPGHVQRLEVEITVDMPLKKFRVYFRGWFEGDDGLFRLSRVFLDPRGIRDDGSLTNPAVEDNYSDSGYETKLKYVINGRGEFVGAHVLAKNGLTDPSIPWVPAVGRYLLKIGINTSVQPNPADNAARAASLACMFGGRVQVFACMFETLLHCILKTVPGNIEDVTIDVRAYSMESRVMSEGKHTLSSIVSRTALAVNKPYPDVKLQLRMIENSFELPSGSITTHDLNKLMQLADIISCDMDDEAAYGYLPAVLR